MTLITDYDQVQYIDGNYNFSSNTYTLIDKGNYNLVNSNDSNKIPEDYYNLFVDENNNIFLCYRVNALYSNTKLTYSFILEYSDKTYIVNNQDYKNIFDLIDKPINSLDGVFSFTDSTLVNTNSRCDGYRYGPMTFLRPEDPDNDSDSKSPVVSSASMFTRFTPFLSIDRVGHIIYVELSDLSIIYADANENSIPKSTYTISEMLKLLIEWAELVKVPWDSVEPISIKSDLFFKGYNIPNEIKSELIDNQAAMQVARFFMGDDNARLRPSIEELSSIAPLLRQWILSKFFFSSIDELKTNLMI